jgi:hypothetical protein
VTEVIAQHPELRTQLNEPLPAGAFGAAPLLVAVQTGNKKSHRRSRTPGGHQPAQLGLVVALNVTSTTTRSGVVSDQARWSTRTTGGGHVDRSSELIAGDPTVYMRVGMDRRRPGSTVDCGCLAARRHRRAMSTTIGDCGDVRWEDALGTRGAETQTYHFHFTEISE